MFYGIEYSTDLRCKQTVVKKFRTENALKKWIDGCRKRSTYADQESARNWHHTFREGWELRGRIDFKHKMFQDYGTSTYPQTKSDNIHSYLFKYGRRVE